MKFRSLLLILCLAAFSGQAQSIFESVPKPTTAKMKMGMMGIAQPQDSVRNLIRPTVIASISFPGSLAQAGVGFAMQHIKYDYEKLRWQSLYSVGAYVLGGVNTSNGVDSAQVVNGLKQLKGIVSASVLVGFANDIVRLGPQYNFIVPPGFKTHWALSAVIGLNFLN